MQSQSRPSKLKGNLNNWMWRDITIYQLGLFPTRNFRTIHHVVHLNVLLSTLTHLEFALTHMHRDTRSESSEAHIAITHNRFFNPSMLSVN